MEKAKKKAIRNLLSVVSSAIFLGFLFSALLLYKYSPSGLYEVKNVLISPDTMMGLNFNDSNNKTGGSSRYIFDKIQFEDGKNNHVVSSDSYRLFYEEIKTAKSLSTVTDEIKNAFNRGSPAKLKILIKTDSPAAWQANTQTFQEMDFSSQGDYFRVYLRESNVGGSSFAYFHQAGIYQKALKMFTGDNL
jgi:hypothetical protein